MVGAFVVGLSLLTKLFKCFGPPHGLPLTTPRSYQPDVYTKALDYGYSYPKIRGYMFTLSIYGDIHGRLPEPIIRIVCESLYMLFVDIVYSVPSHLFIAA